MLKYIIAWLVLVALTAAVLWSFGGEIFQRGPALGTLVIMALVWEKCLESLAKKEGK